MADFNATLEELEIISKIAKRAYKLLNTDTMTIVMDIEATHCNGNSLRLEALLNADDFNFGHDVIGIYNNLNRSSGELMNCFLPRYSD